MIQEEWPVSKDWMVENLPETIKSFIGVVSVVDKEDSLQDRIDITRFSKLQLLYNVTAMILGLFRRIRKKNQINDRNQRNIIMCTQELSLQIRVKKGELKKLCPRYDNGIIVVGGRCSRWNEATWNKQEFIILPYDHPLSSLIALNEHTKSGHLGMSSTIAKIRSKYWIISIDKIVGKIVNRCIGSMKRRAKACQQVMSGLPSGKIKTITTIYQLWGRLFWSFCFKG